jgi:drug/metabolite transporter (DMT)-like permease
VFAHRNRVASPYAGIVVGILATSTGAIFVRYAQAEGVPSLVIAAYRLTLASLVLVPWVMWRCRAELRAMTPRQIGLALVSGASLGVHFGAWISSLALTSVISSVVLVSTNPLFVAFLAVLLLRERLARPVIMGMGVTLIGVLVVGLADACQPNGCPRIAAWASGPAFLGDMLALLGAAGGAVYFTVGRALRVTMSLTAYVFVTYSTAAVCLVVVAAAARLPATGYSTPAYVWFVLLALVPQLLGHSAFNWALKFLPATYVSVTVLGEPAASILLAAVLLGEAPSITKLAGGALILGGILLASQRPRPGLRPR